MKTRPSELFLAAQNMLKQARDGQGPNYNTRFSEALTRLSWAIRSEKNPRAVRCSATCKPYDMKLRCTLAKDHAREHKDVWGRWGKG